MAKKTFKNNNPALAFITQDTQEEQETRKEQGTHQEQRTQGRKGKKLPRINMAFSFDNLDYLQTISRIKGLSMTAYVNKLLEVDKETKKELLEQFKKITEGTEENE